MILIHGLTIFFLLADLLSVSCIGIFSLSPSLRKRFDHRLSSDLGFILQSDILDLQLDFSGLHLGFVCIRWAADDMEMCYKRT